MKYIVVFVFVFLIIIIYYFVVRECVYFIKQFLNTIQIIYKIKIFSFLPLQVSIGVYNIYARTISSQIF